MTTMTTTTTTKKIKILLTDAAPVRIDPAEWPVLAQGNDDSYAGMDAAKHDQAVAQGDVSRWSLRVRQHGDGRTLIYGSADSGWDGAAEPWAGGVLLPTAPADLPAEIRRVGESGGLPERLIRECISDLPVRDL